MDKEYNGWKNYETWNVMVWLDSNGYRGHIADHLKSRCTAGEVPHWGLNQRLGYWKRLKAYPSSVWYDITMMKPSNTLVCPGNLQETESTT